MLLLDRHDGVGKSDGVLRPCYVCYYSNCVQEMLVCSGCRRNSSAQMLEIGSAKKVGPMYSRKSSNFLYSNAEPTMAEIMDITCEHVLNSTSSCYLKEPDSIRVFLRQQDTVFGRSFSKVCVNFVT